MANYFSDGIAEVPFVADEDLTSFQWRLVKAASAAGYCASPTSACDPLPIGILTNDPSAGQEATVKCIGFTKAKARCNSTCDLSQGAFLWGASDAFLEPVDVAGTRVAIARWFGPNVATTDASVLGNVLLFPVGSGCGTSIA